MASRIGAIDHRFGRGETQGECTAFLWGFTVCNEDYRTCIALGRLIQKLLNELATRGVQSHVVSSGLYLLHMVFENLEIFSRLERDIILFALRDLENLLGVPSRDIAFTVRVGYCDRRPAETMRKPMESLFLHPGSASALPG